MNIHIIYLDIHFLMDNIDIIIFDSVLIGWLFNPYLIGWIGWLLVFFIKKNILTILFLTNQLRGSSETTELM